MINQQDALNLIAEALNEPVANIQPGIALEMVEGWDSMGVLLLIAELNERFDILLEEDTLKGLLAVDDILAVLRDRNVLA